MKDIIQILGISMLFTAATGIIGEKIIKELLKPLWNFAKFVISLDMGKLRPVPIPVLLCKSIWMK